MIALAGAVQSAKIRNKKPFNSMLGETYELVTKDFMLIAEKVQHIPRDIIAMYMEGKSYKFSLNSKASPKFKFYGGHGMIDISCCGVVDF